MAEMESNNILRYKVLDALGILAEDLGPIAAKMLSDSGFSSYQANGRISPVENLTRTGDASQVLAATLSYWREVFEPFFGYPESQRVRSFVFQVREVRNAYEGHNDRDYRYADEALMDIRRLLEAFSAHEAAEKVQTLKAPLIPNDPFIEPSMPDVKPPGEVGPVEGATREVLGRGYNLRTPGRGYPPRNQRPFEVIYIGDTGIKIDKLSQEIRFEVLERVVSDIRNSNGEVLIGSQQQGSKPGTLERFLKEANGNDTRTSTYVAPILVESRIAEYVPKPGEKRIRLMPEYMENLP